MLNSRISRMLRELMAQEAPLTSSYLASMNQVTTRTVRNDIKELNTLLNKYGAAINAIRGTGYDLQIDDDQLFRQLLQDVFQSNYTEREAIPNLPEERIQFLIKRFLLEGDYIKLEDLADELYISKSTIQSDLKEVKEIFNSYGIVLDKRPNYGLKAKGEEIKLRYCMSEYIFDRNEMTPDMIHEHLSIISKEEMQNIRVIVLEKIKEYDITLSDIGLSNLIVHIAIACKRVRDENYVLLYPKDLKAIVDTKEYKVATEIVETIGERLEVFFPQTEIAYIAIHLLGTKMVTDASISDKEVEKVIDKEVYDLTMNILDVLEEKLKLGVRDDKELVIGLALHLKPAVNRFRYGMNIRNPMLDAIKANYPVAFEAGILAGMVIQEAMDFDIDENEIGYIALHIGAAIERKKLGNQPKKCIIVCASGVGSSRLLYYRLQSKFGSKLEILGTTEYYKLNQMSLHALDFIISTVPISEELSIPVIEVNTILGETDLKKIESSVLQRKDDSFTYTNEHLVFLQQKFETKEEVLHFLGTQLQDLGLVNEHFINSVFEREAVSPTSFGNLVAIPHPIAPQTDHTFWAVCTLQKPLLWEDKQVQFVCLLCVQKESTEDLQNMYELLGKVVEDRTLVQQLIKCKTYKEFVDIFLKQK